MLDESVADLLKFRRRPTRVVSVGDVAVGGDHPIRVQSMTTTDSMNSLATADQIERLVAAGCEIVRLTVPSIRDAENLSSIKMCLRRRGVEVPLVADIHFTPNAALIAADSVEKVRINPGNFADKKKFEVREYSDAEYAAELERVANRFRPLVKRCKLNGVAMRIGTNHGSLSDRIMNRYGDSPLGMVESALEFLDVCEAESFYDVIFSMKASNTHVAIQAYRLLSSRLAERAPGELSYPFHLGVTEAGDGEDARIKSAIGIGTLLEDGIGDTIRVSLTEDPVREIPVAQAIVRQAQSRRLSDSKRVSSVGDSILPISFDSWVRDRGATRFAEVRQLRIGSAEPVRVEVSLRGSSELGNAERRARSWARSLLGVPDLICESFLIEIDDEAELLALPRLMAGIEAVGSDAPISVRMPVSLVSDGLSSLTRVERWVVDVAARDGCESLETVARLAKKVGVSLEWCLRGDPSDLPAELDRVLQASVSNPVFGISVDMGSAISVNRMLVSLLRAQGAAAMPIVLRQRAQHFDEIELSRIKASIELGSLLCDGIGDMLSMQGGEDPGAALDLAYRILQAARLRTTRTEYISCPSCGRTLFDLEETTAQIKQATDHLKGVKIAIMGCIVNGPGEMADADFGYVGSGPGVVTLYVGKEVVARNIPEREAPGRLTELIQEHGLWQDA